MVKKKLFLVKFFLIIFLVLIIAGLGASYHLKQLKSGKTAINNIKIDSKADIVLNNMHQTSTKNGIKDWTLSASSARLIKNENRAVMQDVKVSFYMKNSNEIFLTSKKGTLDTKKHDMTFSGNVVVRYKENTLTTDKLHYTKKEHIIYSNVHVKIENKDSVMHGDSLLTDLNTSSTTLKGNIKGIFSENFDFF